MPILHRKQKPTFTPLVGTLKCQARGCPNHTAMRCAYVDKRGRECNGIFCPAHWGVINGAVYCRRHANTVRALGDNGRDRRGLPDVDNRGPSLVNWIAREIDDQVRGLLGTVAHGDERVLVDTDVALAYDHHRRPRWERSWKLVETTGLVLKVAIHVDERDDALVTVRVGHEMVAQGVPPWIARRHTGEDIDPELDRLRRELFYRFLEENIREAVKQLRERADRPSWVA
jgi:hypothetical protein